MSANSITEPARSRTHSSTPEFAAAAPALLRGPLAPRLVAPQVRPDVLVHVLRREAVELHLLHRALGDPPVVLHAEDRAHRPGAVNPREAVNQHWVVLLLL